MEPRGLGEPSEEGGGGGTEQVVAEVEGGEGGEGGEARQQLARLGVREATLRQTEARLG